MKKIINWKKYYWYIIFTLFLLPVFNSFFVNLNKIVKSVIAYNEYNALLGKLLNDNDKLVNKVEYYKTSMGIKNLVKERLEKVEDGEVIIKFTDPPKMLE